MVGAPWLLALGALSLVPGLLRGLAAGGPPLGARIVQALVAALLLWRHPVPALWVLLLPQLLLPMKRAWWTALLALAPSLGLAAIGLAAWYRGVVSGLWLAPWEVVGLFVALVLAFLGLGGRGGGSRKPKAPRKGRGR